MLETRALREPETIGRYRVLRTVDDSGRAGVLLAEAPNSRRRVAVRVDLEGRPHEQILDGFLQEREIADALAHPGLVRVVEVGEDPVLGPFLATEFVDGLSLRESLRRGALGLEQALSVLVDVANVVEAAHGAGFAHGDLRPSRIFVDRAGRACVSGFGAAAPAGPICVGAGWAYLAPERLAGSPPSAESDRWSFAAMALELLTGQPLGEDGALPPGLGKTAREVFERALSREPGSRHPSLRAFLEDLLAASMLADADRAALIAGLPPPRRALLTREEIAGRQRRVIAFAAFGVVAALCLRAGGDWMLDRIPQPRALRVLEVSSAPAGATVLVDGVPVGETPRRTFAPANVRRVRVMKEDFLPVDHVLERSEREIAVALVPSRPIQVARAPRRVAPHVESGPRAPAPAAPADGTLEGPVGEEATGLIPLVTEWLRDERR